MRFSDFKNFFPVSRFWLFFNPLQLTKILLIDWYYTHSPFAFTVYPSTVVSTAKAPEL